MSALGHKRTFCVALIVSAKAKRRTLSNLWFALKAGVVFLIDGLLRTALPDNFAPRVLASNHSTIFETFPFGCHFVYSHGTG